MTDMEGFKSRKRTVGFIGLDNQQVPSSDFSVPIQIADYTPYNVGRIRP